MRAWGIAISSGHLALALAGWLALGVPPWFFGGCALLTLGVTLLAAPLMRPRRDDDGDGPDGPGGGPRTPTAVVAGVRARVPRLRASATRHLTAR